MHMKPARNLAGVERDRRNCFASPPRTGNTSDRRLASGGNHDNRYFKYLLIKRPDSTDFLCGSGLCTQRQTPTRPDLSSTGIKSTTTPLCAPTHIA